MSRRERRRRRLFAVKIISSSLVWLSHTEKVEFDIRWLDVISIVWWTITTQFQFNQLIVSHFNPPTQVEPSISRSLNSVLKFALSTSATFSFFSLNFSALISSSQFFLLHNNEVFHVLHTFVSILFTYRAAWHIHAQHRLQASSTWNPIAMVYGRRALSSDRRLVGRTPSLLRVKDAWCGQQWLLRVDWTW